MKIKITDDDSTKWFVSLYGKGGEVDVRNEIVADAFYELTPAEFRYAMLNMRFVAKDITRLLIPDYCAEVIDAVS